MLRHRPHPQFAEEFCQRRRLIMRIQSTRVGQYPRMAATKQVLLQPDAGVFDTAHDAVGTDADEGDDGGAQTFHFGFEASTASAKFVVGQFIGTGGGAIDDVGDAEIEIEKEFTLKGREEARRESAIVECGPEAVAGPAEVSADGGGVEARVDAGEKDDEVLGDEIRHALVVSSEQLGLGRFPRLRNSAFHRVESFFPRQFFVW